MVTPSPRPPDEPGSPGPGRVRTRPSTDGVTELLALEHLPGDPGTAARVLTDLIDTAFRTGSVRVEAEIPVQATDLRRLLQRAGLRPEGVARSRGATNADGRRADLLRLARLRDDPRPGTPEAFLAMLDASLPLKRVIVQGLAHDGEGRVLLCELTYKKAWDLPGGVADPAESPVASLERELAEELGLRLAVGRLLAVDWLPPYRQWSDAVLLVFDLGDLTGVEEQATLQRSELVGLRWVAPEELSDHVAPYAARLLSTIVPVARGLAEQRVVVQDPVFLEDGRPRTLP